MMLVMRQIQAVELSNNWQIFLWHMTRDDDLTKQLGIEYCRGKETQKQETADDRVGDNTRTKRTLALAGKSRKVQILASE
jgi:hypothetical protein